MIRNIISLVIIFVLILCVGFFTSSETAYLSLSRLKLRSMLDERKKHAELVAKLKSNMGRLLTTVLVGTNFLSTLVSALATSLVVKIFGGGGVGLPTIVVAFFMTTFGQIIPKTIAGMAPERLSCFSAVPLKLLEIVFFPVITLFQGLSKSAVWIVEKIIKPKEAIVTEEELRTLIDVGEKEGTIEKSESKMLNKIIKFNDLNVSDIMKHRSFVSSVDFNSTYEETSAEFLRTGFSTLTVYKNTPENVVGVLNYKKLLYANASQAEDNEEGFAGRMMSEVFFVPGTFSVIDLLQKFREEEHKFAVVLSEQGEMSGIVTMEDIIRVVFGRMTDENSYDSLPAEDKIQLVSYNTFIVPGELLLDDVNEILGLRLESEDMNTIGGWLLEQFGYLPSTGNVFVLDNVIYTVEDVYQRRIVSVRVRKNN